MIYLTVGFGILIMQTYLKPLYRYILIKPGMTGAEINPLNLYSEALLIPSILIAWVICKKISIEKSYPAKNKSVGTVILKLGVYLFFLHLFVYLTSRTVPGAVYLIGQVPFSGFLFSIIFYQTIHGLLFYGVLHAFLITNNQNKITT